jgi:hypothetical protein
MGGVSPPALDQAPGRRTRIVVGGHATL